MQVLLEDYQKEVKKEMTRFQALKVNISVTPYVKATSQVILQILRIDLSKVLTHNIFNYTHVKRESISEHFEEELLNTAWQGFTHSGST